MTDGSSSIALYRERSATDVINVSFQFLRDQFGALLKGLLFLAGPFLIVANMVVPFATGPQAVATGGTRLVLLFLVQYPLTLIGSVVACAVVIGALEVYRVEGESALTTRRLWGMARTHGMGLFGRQIQLGLVVGLIAGLLAGLFLGIGGAVGAFGGGVGGEVLVVLGLLFLAVLGWVFYAGPTFSMLLPGQVDAERSISLARCVRLVRGRWGQTLAVWLLASFISVILFSVGWFSWFVLGALKGLGIKLGSAGLLVTGVISGVANTLAPAITYTAITIQYYNLIEQKEQVSLEEEVKRMEEGEASAADPSLDEAREDASVEGSATPGSAESAPDADAAASEPDGDARWRGDGGDEPNRPN